MDQLLSMKVFVQVAQQTGFATAARNLRMSPAAVSKYVSALEARIGARLLDRTTRRVGLTEVGRVYLDRCLECLHAFEDADAAVSELAKDPRGLLRVAAPIDFGECLQPVLAEVMIAYPCITIDLRLSNRVVDMVEEGVDVAVRAAPALDGRYVARPLARSRLAIYGSPEYFRKYGRPLKPEDLPSHRSIVFVEPKPLDEFVFVRNGRKVQVKLNSVMTTNNGDGIRGAVRRAVGLGAMPSFLASPDIKAGLIEPVLINWSLPEYTIFAVYPHRRFLSPKVRVFIEALRAAFGDGTRDPWWPEALSEIPDSKLAARCRPGRVGSDRSAKP
jgi:DNA-binding transcriptional LysR family regulator